MMHTAVIRKVTITMGRTSILTDRKKRAALIRAAGCLVSSRAAAGLAGCAPRTVQNLLKIGEGDLEDRETGALHYLTIEASFLLDWNRARAEKQLELLRRIEEEGRPADLLKLLERTWPEDFARKQQIGVQQNTEVTIRVIEADGRDWTGGSPVAPGPLPAGEAGART